MNSEDMQIAQMADFRRQIFARELAPSTLSAYRKGWASFQTYATEIGLSDPYEADDEIIAGWLIYMATTPRPKTRQRPSGLPYSIGTIETYKAGVHKAFELAGHTSPCDTPLVRAAMRGLARGNSRATRLLTPLREHDIEAMLAACPPTPIGMRDAVIIALGFAAALRRSELVSLQVSDIDILDQHEDDDAKMFILVSQSKTDQGGRGYKIPVLNGRRIRAVTHVRRWLRHTEITDGPLIRAMIRGGNIRSTPLHHTDVARIVKEYARKIGLDTENISSHSLRAGFITSAAAHRARMDKIMEVSRHKSPNMVLHYTRDSDVFGEHAGQGFL